MVDGKTILFILFFFLLAGISALLHKEDPASWLVIPISLSLGAIVVAGYVFHKVYYKSCKKAYKKFTSCKLSDREQKVYAYIINSNVFSISDDDSSYDEKLKRFGLNHDEIENVKKAIEAFKSDIIKEHLRKT